MAVESSEIQRGEYLPRVADGLLTQALQSSGAVSSTPLTPADEEDSVATGERSRINSELRQDPERM